MKPTAYGKDVIRKVLLVSAVLVILALFLPPWLMFTTFAVVFILLLFTFYFFRDPVRALPDNITENIIISPADGKVVSNEVIEFSKDYFFEKGEKLRFVSIFLSPLNVHVNCFPVSGTVEYYNYIKGEYLVAFDHKSSERNERTEIGIVTNNGRKLLFKQIAGYVARRIVCYIKPGDKVKIGDKFGMIKFGSRMDLLFSPDSKVFVKPGDKVTAGETIIAEFN